MFENLIKNDQLKYVLIALVCVTIVIFLYYVFIAEGFDNKLSCSLNSTVVTDAKKTMDQIKKIYPTESLSNQINLGINYRDMLTRDIILGDNTKKWCDELTEQEKEELLNKASDKSYLFNNGIE